MDRSSLKLEIIGFVVATNLTSFGVGMLLVAVNFDLVSFFLGAEFYLNLVVLFGAGWLVYWAYILFRNVWRVLEQ